jgi:hypothetical protein
MQTPELARYLAGIEDHLLRCGWDSWEFELTNTTHLYAPWSSPPLPQVKPSDRVVAKYVLRDKARHPVVFCLAEFADEHLPDTPPEREFLKILASFHASLEELPVAMYTHRGETWDYVNLAGGEDWHTDEAFTPVPLAERCVHELAVKAHSAPGPAA